MLQNLVRKLVQKLPRLLMRAQRRESQQLHQLEQKLVQMGQGHWLQGQVPLMRGL